MRPEREYSLSGFCHLFNIVPIWGLIFCGWIWYSMREESRLVVHHARQAMVFHSALLAGLLVWVLLGLFARLISVISPSASSAIKHVNDWIMGLFYIAYFASCLLGCVRTMSGQPFRYPLAGLSKNSQ